MSKDDLLMEIKVMAQTDKLTQVQANRLILASMVELLQTLRTVENSLSDLDRRVFTIETTIVHYPSTTMLDTLRTVEASLAKLDQRALDIENTIENYPSITWLLRYKTKQTIAIILALFVILSLLYISDFRNPILQWFGLPNY